MSQTSIYHIKPVLTWSNWVTYPEIWFESKRPYENVFFFQLSRIELAVWTNTALLSEQILAWGIEMWVYVRKGCQTLSGAYFLLPSLTVSYCRAQDTPNRSPWKIQALPWSKHCRLQKHQNAEKRHEKALLL